MDTQPFPATAFVVDFRGFGKLTNPQQLDARRRLYRRMTDAFDRGQVPWQSCACEDRGDGMLVLAPASVPKPLLLGGVLAELVRSRDDADASQLRVAVHTGDIHHDGHGFVGSDVNEAFRLANAAPLREALRRTTAGCAILVSDVLYRGIVRHGYGDLDPRAYHAVSVREKETDTVAWLTVPGDDPAAKAVAADFPPAGSPAAAAPAGVHLDSGGGRLAVTRSVIAGGNVTFRDPQF
jgi:hypothetical protein